MRFTPTATRIINLIQSDIGRPVGHIVSNLKGYDRLEVDTQSVLDTLVSKELEVQTKAGKCYMLRIMPYRTLDNVIEGAVITFVDVTEIEKAREELREKESRFQQLIESLPQLSWTCQPRWALRLPQSTMDRILWRAGISTIGVRMARPGASGRSKRVKERHGTPRSQRGIPFK